MFPTLIPNEVLRRRIAELAVKISQDHQDEPPYMVTVLEGARVFADALCRLLPGQPDYKKIRASSYPDGTVSSGNVDIRSEDELEVEGRVVLLVEDIVDTGRTVAALREHFLGEGAKAVHVVTLLSKPSRRTVDVELEYVGFEIPDEFVIGFGMDLNGKYRELDSVSIYKKELEAAANA